MKDVKILENKGASGVEVARYYIAYAGKGNKDARKKKSFEIISRLKGDRNVIIELRSSLLSIDIFKREKVAMDFQRGIKELGLSFRSRKVQSRDSVSIIQKLFSFGQTPKDSYEIFTYVSNDTWNDPAFQALLPYNGIMCYACKEGTDGEKLMEDLFNGQVFDEEKFDLFEFFIYDCIDFGQMGIFSNKMDKADIEGILEGK